MPAELGTHFSFDPTLNGPTADPFEPKTLWPHGVAWSTPDKHSLVQMTYASVKGAAAIIQGKSPPEELGVFALSDES